jgi:hypothetical protein
VCVIGVRFCTVVALIRFYVVQMARELVVVGLLSCHLCVNRFFGEQSAYI